MCSSELDLIESLKYNNIVTGFHWIFVVSSTFCYHKTKLLIIIIIIAKLIISC